MGGRVDAESLLYVLALARLGRLNAASEVLGVAHTTVSRRVDEVEHRLGARVFVRTPAGWETTEFGQRVVAAAEDIERAISDLSTNRALNGVVRVASPDAFGTHIAVPAVRTLADTEPRLQIELLTATRRQSQNRTGMDIDVVIGEPSKSSRVSATCLGAYELGLYASLSYIDRHGPIRTLSDLRHHRLIYYVESSLDVADLSAAVAAVPPSRHTFRSTSVHAHAQAVVLGTGVGLLPAYMADGIQDVIRVVPDDYGRRVTYWALVREEAARNAAVRVVMHALVREAGEVLQTT